MTPDDISGINETRADAADEWEQDLRDNGDLDQYDRSTT